MNFLIGFLISTIIAYIAYKLKTLNTSGFVAASLAGTMLYGFGGVILFSLLIIFFISSSVITKISKEKKKKKSKGRNFIQVFANSFMAIIFAIGFYITKHHSFLVVSVISIAATTSDTWGSEIGKFAKGKVISIVNFKEIKKGESGGISLLGSFASLFGSMFIASVYVLLYTVTKEFRISLLIDASIITTAGMLGSIIDSYLGIIIQEKFRHIETGETVEKVNDRRKHPLISGIMFVNNDMVNFLATLIISLIFGLILIN